MDFRWLYDGFTTVKAFHAAGLCGTAAIADEKETGYSMTTVTLWRLYHQIRRYSMSVARTLMTSLQMAESLDSLAARLLTRHGDCRRLALVGIQRRGVALANRLCGLMSGHLGAPVLSGSLDITLYRDDWTTMGPKPAIGKTSIGFDVVGKTLVLVDDVLFTGRTIRAALEALTDFGRPSRVELLVLVDRGHRELPIHADYAGLTLETKISQRVDVLVEEYDGLDEVRLAGA